MPETYAKLHYENNVDFVPDAVEGPFGIPVIRPEVYEQTVFFPFGNKNANYKRWDHGVHFFVSDYRFQGIWNNKERYRQMLTEYQAVMTPDFSLYTDWPKMVQVWNHYRKHVLGAWMQSIGCKVYPSIAWSDESSFEWCFDGEPHGATVCVSSVGTQRNRDAKRMFLIGYDRMMEVLEPETVLFHGTVPPECKGKIVPVEEFTRRFRELR